MHIQKEQRKEALLRAWLPKSGHACDCNIIHECKNLECKNNPFKTELMNGMINLANEDLW